MKTFRDFVLISEDKMAERLGKMSDSDFEQFLKGRTAGEVKTYKQKRAQFRTTNVSGQDIRSGSQTRTQTPPRQPSGSTQTTPRETQTNTQTTPRGAQTSSGSTPPPSNSQRPESSTPPRNTSGQSSSPSPQQQKPKSNFKTKAGKVFRGGVGALSAVDAADAVASGDYGRAAESGLYAAGSSNRLNRNVSRLGQRAVQGAASRLGMNAAGKVASRFVPGLQTAAGLTSGSRALARGDKLGAVLGYGSAIPGPVGYGFAAADIAREFVPSSVKKSIKDKTGITYLQQRKGLEQKAIQSGQGLRGIERARQTMDTRGARQVAARTGAYGARQGSALTGIGGNTITSKDTKGNAFISTGAGSQRRTAQLAKTQLVRDPKTGKQVVGDLAFKGGKATYLARPSIASRDTSLAARVGRALNIGKYSRSAEQQASKQEYRTALRNTQQYQRQLGVKSTTALPGRGVGPKKVGPKLVGPKKVGPKIVGPRKPAPKPSPSVMARPV